MDGADNEQKLPLIVIAGPTAAGKSEIALAVAEQVGGEIISADSAQVYRGLNVGTAKVMGPDRQRVPHWGLDVVEPSATFSVKDFQQLARQAVIDIVGRGRLPIVVGGTGLWIRALVEHYALPEAVGATPWRARLTHAGETWGWDSLRRQLKVVDPDSYRRIDPHDHRRLVRALEVFMAAGHRLTHQPGETSPFQVVFWVLTWPPPQLKQRIRERTQHMIQHGLEDEVAELLRQGVPRTAQSLNAIGYRETVDWFYGRLTRAERDRLIVRHTEQYAKRQLTWFRAEKRARWLDLSVWTRAEAIAKIVDSCAGFGV